LRQYQRLQHNAQRHSGTYRALPPINWKQLVQDNFLSPHWTQLYPFPSSSSSAETTPNQLAMTWAGVGKKAPKERIEIPLPPRLACKLFYDGIYLLDTSPGPGSKLEDLLPSSIHKFFKKKQWRKQFEESFRRILCRLANGFSLFHSNCTAEEMCVRVLISFALEIGWNHCRRYWEPLPENDPLDHELLAQLSQVVTGSNEEIENLYREGAKANPCRLRDWFTAFRNDEETMTNHIFDGYLLIPSVMSIDPLDDEVFVEIEL
jgi:hypothetical protein